MGPMVAFRVNVQVSLLQWRLHGARSDGVLRSDRDGRRGGVAKRQELAAGGRI
jgi:hypothetical protein